MKYINLLEYTNKCKISDIQSTYPLGNYYYKSWAIKTKTIRYEKAAVKLFIRYFQNEMIRTNLL